MIEFIKNENEVILSYTSEQPDTSWVYGKLNKSGEVTLSKIFHVTKNELISSIDDENTDGSIGFVIAKKKDDYYSFPKDVLGINHDLYIHKDIKLERKKFVAERGISIFVKIDNLVNSSIYVGGNNENCIPEDVFNTLLKGFPNTTEVNKYVSARIDSVLSTYLDIKEDHEANYQNYLNKKISKKGANLQLHYSQLEYIKYSNLLDKLKYMLENENSYNEHQWQEELLQIILMLYPKYIYVFKEAPVRDAYNNKNRKIDCLLIDSSGNTDIIEIKKPFDKCIITERTYRDNYIPLRELSGTVMQIEKYIFYLNKSGLKGEEKLTNHYKKDIADNFKIRITNPCGLIIMGRTTGLSEEQIQDFEVIKRKYKNVIDILTYDDLISRLEFTINQWRGMNNQSLK